MATHDIQRQAPWGVRVARRAVRRLRAAIRPRPTPPPAAAPAATTDADTLRRSRGQVRRLRRKLAETETEREQLKQELAATRDSLRDPDPRVVVPEAAQAAIAAVREEKLSYLPVPNLSTLARIVVETERAGRPGLILECGTARGGSAIVMAAAKATDRPMRVYDVFGTIPPPTDADGPDVHARYQRILDGKARGPGGDIYYGYRPDLFDEVTDSFTRLVAPPETINVELVKGLFEDTVRIDEPVAFAHLDGDWYESTMTCLQRIAPHVVPGGRIVLDDYWMWSGCRTAVDEYFADKPEFHLERRVKLHAVRL